MLDPDAARVSRLRFPVSLKPLLHGNQFSRALAGSWSSGIDAELSRFGTQGALQLESANDAVLAAGTRPLNELSELVR